MRRVRHRRLDEEHSNLVRRWHKLGAGADWPTDDQWRALAPGPAASGRRTVGG